jgi:hypothetical protein
MGNALRCFPSCSSQRTVWSIPGSGMEQTLFFAQTEKAGFTPAPKGRSRPQRETKSKENDNLSQSSQSAQRKTVSSVDVRSTKETAPEKRPETKMEM